MEKYVTVVIRKERRAHSCVLESLSSVFVKPDFPLFIYKTGEEEDSFVRVYSSHANFKPQYWGWMFTCCGSHRKRTVRMCWCILDYPSKKIPKSWFSSCVLFMFRHLSKWLFQSQLTAGLPKQINRTCGLSYIKIKRHEKNKKKPHYVQNWLPSSCHKIINLSWGMLNLQKA